MSRVLDEAGVTLVAENARKFVSDMREATAALGSWKTAVEAAKAIKGPDTLGVALGASVAAAAGTATAALGALAGAFTAVGAVTAYATSRALGYADAIDRIQAVTSLSVGMAQKLYAGSVIAGQGVNVITDAFGQLANRLDQARTVEDSLNGMGGAAESAARSLRRLNEDHARFVLETGQALAQSLADLNTQNEAQQADYYRTLGRMNDDYQRETLRRQEEFNTSLADLDANHAQKVADTQASLAEMQEDYARTEAEREADLQATLEGLRQDAAENEAAIRAKQAEDETSLAERTGAELTAIQQRYADKRQSIMERIADPSTNPIMRAFLRSQLGGLGSQEAGEIAAANAKAAAERQRIQDRANFEIAETRRKLAEQEALEQAKNARQVADAQRTYARRLAELQLAIERENAEYDKQRQRLIQANAQREEDAQRSYQRQSEDLNRAHEAQLAQYQAQNARILAENQRRIDDEARQYARQLEDMAASGGGAAASITPLSRAFSQLGIDMATFMKLKPDEQFKMLRKAIEGMSEGQAFTILSDLFGPSRADEIMNFFAALKMADEVGAPFDENDIADMQQTQREFNLIKLQADLLWAEIGRDLLPIIKELMAQFKEWWQKHGPEVIAFLREFTSKTVPEVVQSIKDIAKWIDQAIRDVSQWVNTAAADLKKANDDATAWFNNLGRIVEGFLADLKKANDDVTAWFNEAARKVDRFIDNVKWLFSEANRVATEWGANIRDVVVGALAGLRDEVGRILSAIGQFFIQNTLVGRLWEIVGGIDGIKRALEFAKARFDDLFRALQGLQLPWWLTPGSPTPLENGLVGIQKALASVGRQMPVLDGLAGSGATVARNQPASASAIYQGATSNYKTTTTVTIPITINGASSSTGQRVADDIVASLNRAGVRVTR